VRRRRSERAVGALLAGAALLLAPTWSLPAQAAQDGGVRTPRAEKRERRRYCRILERQLRPDVQRGGSVSAGVFGIGGNYRLDYPNDLANQFLAAHNDLVFACRRWQRGEIPTTAFEEVRERYIAVYMAGTDADDEERNRLFLERIINSVSEYGFSRERQAELGREFTAIRESIERGEAANLSRSDAILKALADADTRAAASGGRIEARLAAIERYLTPAPPADPGAGCRATFRIDFAPGRTDLPPAHPEILRSVACAASGDSLVVVAGYADSRTGTPDLNLRLSAQRAAAVARAFSLAGGRIDRLEYEGGTSRFGPAPAVNRVATIVVTPRPGRAADDANRPVADIVTPSAE
jgi:outer membrane protein OmpA-like peptidoglycan-associated protein